MDNITMLDSFPAEAVMGIDRGVNPYLKNSTDPSLDMYNNTQTDWTTAEGSEEYKLPLTALWVYFAVRILWGCLAIFGNSLTILAVIRYERLQTCTNYLICSLAVSDLVSSVTVPFIIVYELYPNSWFFIPTCLFQKILSLISTGGNMYNILYLSIDRYIYVAFPLRYHGLVTPQRIAIILTITWSFRLIIIPVIVFKATHLQVGMSCTYAIFLSLVRNIYLFPQFVAFVTLTIGFNLAIARIARKQARQIQAQQQPYSTLDVAINQSTKRISRTLALVFGVYLFSYMPQLIMACITYYKRHMQQLDRFTTLFYWANTWVNPLIYAWRLKDFRIAFKKIFTGTGSFNEVV